MSVIEPAEVAPALRVAIGEDDVLLREGIARILTGAGLDVVAQAGDADDLLRRTLAHRPDVAIVDVRMPPRREDDGLIAAIQLRRRLPDTGVLILSQFCEPVFALELIGAQRASATCSRNASATSGRFWTPSRASRPAAARSTPRWSAGCSGVPIQTTRCTG